MASRTGLSRRWSGRGRAPSGCRPVNLVARGSGGAPASVPEPGNHAGGQFRLGGGRWRRSRSPRRVVFRSSGQDLTAVRTCVGTASRFIEPLLLGPAVPALRARLRRRLSPRPEVLYRGAALFRVPLQPGQHPGGPGVHAHPAVGGQAPSPPGGARGKQPPGEREANPGPLTRALRRSSRRAGSGCVSHVESVAPLRTGLLQIDTSPLEGVRCVARCVDAKLRGATAPSFASRPRLRPRTPALQRPLCLGASAQASHPAGARRAVAVRRGRPMPGGRAAAHASVTCMPPCSRTSRISPNRS